MKKINKDLLIPFDDTGLMDYYDGTINRILNQYNPETKDFTGKPYRWHESAKELKKYYEFSEDMKIIGYSRGRSSIKINLESLKNGQRYSMFISDFDDIIREIIIDKGIIKEQTWGFIKKGQNYGIYMVKNVK